MIIEFYDRRVSTRDQDRRIGFLVKSGDGIVGTSREVFVENVKLARCRAEKSLKEWVAYHKRKYAVKSERQTGSGRQRMQDANIIKLYRRVQVLLFRWLEGPEAEGTVEGWKPRKRGDAKTRRQL